MAKYVIITRAYSLGNGYPVGDPDSQIIDTKKNRAYDGCQNESEVKNTWSELLVTMQDPAPSTAFRIEGVGCLEKD